MSLTAFYWAVLPTPSVCFLGVTLRLVLLLLGYKFFQAVMPPLPQFEILCSCVCGQILMRKGFQILLGVKQDYGKADLSVEVSLKGHEWGWGVGWGGGDISLYKILDKKK